MIFLSYSRRDAATVRPIASGEFAGKYIAGDDASPMSRAMGPYAGTWVAESDKAVKITYRRRSLLTERPCSFVFDVLKPQELRGTTDFGGPGWNNTLWRRE